MPEKPIIYNVTIEKSEKENSHRITWHNPKTDTKEYFDSEAEITAEEAKTLWQKRKHQHPVGAKLFRFLDGNNRYFQDCLHHAYLQGEPIHMHLHTNRETADWPFELLAYEDKFLLPYRLHLDRSITQFGAGKKISPKKRPLKLLFMACSAMDVKSVLNYEREEEAIYQITRNLSIDMEVDDTGTLEGLYNRLEQEEYDVVHLSGHADINKKKRPFFVMEDETGKHQRVYPEDLWNKALIENHPRLLFLSGCHTGHTPDSPENPAAVSFSRLLVEEYDVPAVLGWGRSVGDKQAIHAQNLLYHELCRGKSILHAVRRARLQMLTHFRMSSTPAWPLLRLFSSGIPLNAIVQKGLPRRPKARRTRFLYLKRSRIKVLTKGFIGQRRQIQSALRALKPGSDKNGIIILGTAGLGKSCLAARISQRFAGVTMIIIQGKLEKNTLQRALKDAFIAAQDKEGEKILARKTTMIKKLDDLCVTSFKKNQYLLLLDEFDQNLEGAANGTPGPLQREAKELLNVLLPGLDNNDQMTRLIITSRYEFTLMAQNEDQVNERLTAIRINGFRELEQGKKSRGLKNIIDRKDKNGKEDKKLIAKLIAAGHGNPLLMEQVDAVAGEMIGKEEEQLWTAIQNTKETFIRQHHLRELLQQGGDPLMQFLCSISVFRKPVLERGVELAAKEAGLEKWQKLLRRGIALSLIEFDQAHRSYQVTPLLQEDLLQEKKEQKGQTKTHEAALKYYSEICATRDPLEPEQAIELTYHSLASGQEEEAAHQGALLVEHYQEYLDHDKSRRLGEWILAAKKKDCTTAADAALLKALAETLRERDKPTSRAYYQQAHSIYRTLYGPEHPETKNTQEDLAQLKN